MAVGNLALLRPQGQILIQVMLLARLCCLDVQGLAEVLKGPCSAHCGNKFWMYKNSTAVLPVQQSCFSPILL